MKKALATFTISVDFDGILAETADYPQIGPPILMNIAAVHALYTQGHTLILNTCREGEGLEAVLDWLRLYDLEDCFAYINENTKELKEVYGTDPRKVAAHIYWDDRAVSSLDGLLIRLTHMILMEATHNELPKES